MMSFEEAKNKGMRACIEKMGRGFLEEKKDLTCTGYGDADDFAFCFIGIGSDLDSVVEDEIVLTADTKNKFPYFVSCNVWYKNGEVEFKDCVLPEM